MQDESQHALDASKIVPKYEVKSSEKIPDWIVNEAFLINEALGKGVVDKTQAQEGLAKNKELLEMIKGLISKTLFVEYSPDTAKEGEDRGEELLKLFSSEVSVDGQEMPLAEYLAKKRQGVSLAMITLDDSTAKAVRYLNDKGVPVVGWVVVDDVEGYWTNKANMSATIKKTADIKAWAEREGLVLEALGFDLERPLGVMQAVNRGDIVGLAKELWRYLQDRREEAKRGDPETRFRDLIAQLEASETPTELYVAPGITAGVVGDILPGNHPRFVEMVYTSAAPGTMRLRTAGSIPAFGIVSAVEGQSPGRQLGKEGSLPKHLTTEDLARDIKAVLDTELDLDNRVFKLRDLYLFALNNARVALMLEQAMDTAFKAKEDEVAGQL